MISYNILLIINSCLIIHHLVATPLVCHRVPFIDGKNTSQASSQSSTKSASQSVGNKTSDHTGNRIACYGCSKFGHLRRNCRSNPGDFQISKGNSSENVQFCLDNKNPRKFMCCISVSGTPVSTICKDTGCSSVIVSDSILPDAITTNVPNVDVDDYLGRMDTFPVIKCYLQCHYYTG